MRIDATTFSHNRRLHLVQTVNLGYPSPNFTILQFLHDCKFTGCPTKNVSTLSRLCFPQFLSFVHTENYKWQAWRLQWKAWWLLALILWPGTEDLDLEISEDYSWRFFLEIFLRFLLRCSWRLCCLHSCTPLCCLHAASLLTIHMLLRWYHAASLLAHRFAMGPHFCPGNILVSLLRSQEGGPCGRDRLEQASRLVQNQLPRCFGSGLKVHVGIG